MEQLRRRVANPILLLLTYKPLDFDCSVVQGHLRMVSSDVL